LRWDRRNGIEGDRRMIFDGIKSCGGQLLEAMETVYVSVNARREVYLQMVASHL
jgi:hypothetical protein